MSLGSVVRQADMFEYLSTLVMSYQTKVSRRHLVFTSVLVLCIFNHVFVRNYNFMSTFITLKASASQEIELVLFGRVYPTIIIPLSSKISFGFFRPFYVYAMNYL